MCAKESDRKPSPLPCLVASTIAICLVATAPARAAEGLWDAVLEKMNIKAAPPGPGPDFVQRTRPDPASLGYLPTATPHKVSPVPVKTPGQVQAGKDALDAAKRRQLDPGVPKPLGAPRAKGAAGARASAVAD